MPPGSDDPDSKPGPVPEQTEDVEMYTCLFCGGKSAMDEAQQHTEGGSFYLRCTSCGESA